MKAASLTQQKVFVDRRQVEALTRSVDPFRRPGPLFDQPCNRMAQRITLGCDRGHEGGGTSDRAAGDWGDGPDGRDASVAAWFMAQTARRKAFHHRVVGRMPRADQPRGTELKKFAPHAPILRSCRGLRKSPEHRLA